MTLKDYCEQIIKQFLNIQLIIPSDPDYYIEVSRFILSSTLLNDDD